MPTTASDIIQTGARFNPNDPGSVAEGANVATVSSAPPYQPLVGPGSGATITQQGPNGPWEQPLHSYAISENMFNANNPAGILRPSTTFGYNPITSGPGENLNYNQMPGTLSNSAATGTATQAPGAQPNAAGQYNATQVSGVHGTVDPNSLVQNQFSQLMGPENDANNNGVPDWAQTAVTAANQRMNALGLGASTMAGGATAAAILNTALPMATFNANLVATLNLQNLSNDQSAMLSSAAWDNAAKQFNATSEQQNQQFFTNLTAQIADQNANRTSTMAQFNAGQTNSMQQFVDNLNSQRQEFNSQNQLLVDQSNVQWRRTINTANTAGQNAANQANVQNTFNVQQTDLNNLWQQARDEASWALTSSENSQNRALSLVNSSLNRQTSLDIMNSQMQAAMYSQLGSFGVNLLGGLFGGNNGASSIGSGISNLFGSSSSGVSSDGGGNPGTGADTSGFFQ